MGSTTTPTLTRRRVAVIGLALLALAACSDPKRAEIKNLKTEVEDRFGAKDYARGLEASQKGFALARDLEGDQHPDTLYFAQGISQSLIGMRNWSGAMRALKQELALRSAAGQPEKKLQPRRTILIKLAEENGDHMTAIEQTVIVAAGIGMGPGKDPQPTYKTDTAYPPDLYRQEIEGDVDIGYDLDADGKPQDAHVVKSNPVHVFDAAALDSFRKWRFTPFIQNGQPIASSDHHYTLAFRIPKK
jgi:TonB family protein